VHDLRHCFASMLIAAGADVDFGARQLGHANPAITLRVYAHLFDSEAQETRMRDALEARFGGNAVVTSEGKEGGDTGTFPDRQRPFHAPLNRPVSPKYACHAEGRGFERLHPLLESGDA
jgi:hypothetical protein